MPHRVRLTARAKRDIADIRSYFASDDKRAAERVRQQILHAISLLADYPLIGTASDEAQVRVKLVRHYPYRIYYRVMGDVIEILHVRHTARKEPDPQDLT